MEDDPHHAGLDKGTAALLEDLERFYQDPDRDSYSCRYDQFLEVVAGRTINPNIIGMRLACANCLARTGILNGQVEVLEGECSQPSPND